MGFFIIHQDFILSATLKRHAPKYENVEYNSKRKDIYLLVVSFGLEDLGSNVAWGATFLINLVSCVTFGVAEVGEYHKRQALLLWYKNTL